MAYSAMEIHRIKNRCVIDHVISTVVEDEILDDLDAGDIFTRCLDTLKLPDEDREELTVFYKEIIKFLHGKDFNAE